MQFDYEIKIEPVEPETVTIEQPFVVGGGGEGDPTIPPRVAKLETDVDKLKSDLTKKQDKLVAGANIQIAADGKTISATGGGTPYDDAELRSRIGAVETELVGVSALADDIAEVVGA